MGSQECSGSFAASVRTRVADGKREPMTEDVPALPSGERAAMEPTGGAFGVNSGSEAARRYDVNRTRGTSGKCSACGFESLAMLDGRCALCRCLETASS